MSEAAVALEGELIGPDQLFSAVSKDTRDISPGSLYVALQANAIMATTLSNKPPQPVLPVLS
jgi:UDP-N-acetylmuramyl pentapeptide synthase